MIFLSYSIDPKKNLLLFVCLCQGWDEYRGLPSPGSPLCVTDVSIFKLTFIHPHTFWEQVSHTERLCWWVGNSGPTGILRIKHKISPPPSLQNFKDYLIQNPLLLPKKNHGITNQESKDFGQTQTVSRLSGEILKNDACHNHFFYVLFLSLFLLFLCTLQCEIFDYQKSK